MKSVGAKAKIRVPLSAVRASLAANRTSHCPTSNPAAMSRFYPCVLVRELTRVLWLGFATGLLLLGAARGADAPFELKAGDRVVFLGDTVIEREQYSGWIELMLTTRFPDRSITFRNLGWSGDTPAGDSRFGLSLLQAGREPADEGWNQLVKQIEEAKPTVVFVGYGMASSFDGEK